MFTLEEAVKEDIGYCTYAARWGLSHEEVKTEKMTAIPGKNRWWPQEIKKQEKGNNGNHFLRHEFGKQSDPEGMRSVSSNDYEANNQHFSTRHAPASARSKEQAGYVSLSFETISGYGPNGAVIHYAAQKETARALGTDSLFLLVRRTSFAFKLVVVSCGSRLV